LPSITAVVDEVTHKTTAKGNDMFTVVAGGKKITTFERDHAETAKSLKGQKATIDYVEKENGQYVNLNLVSIKPFEEKLAAGFSPTPDEKQDSIQRQCALKAAVEFNKALGEKASIGGVVAAAEAFNSWLNGAPAESGPSEGNSLDDDVPFLPTV